MSVTFPGETKEYRAARDRLLEQEIELRRAIEEVAAARREASARRCVPEDYVFQGPARRRPTDVGSRSSSRRARTRSRSTA